jgi:thiosulfate dehydrogenase
MKTLALTIFLGVAAVCPTSSNGDEIDLPKPGTAIADIVLATALFNTYRSRASQPWAAPLLDDISGGPEGEDIRMGLRLVTHTSEMIGPRAPDVGKRYSRNDLNCVSCHQAGPSGLPGTKPFGLLWVNVRNDYPKFDDEAGKVLSLEMRIAGMLGAGKPPIALDSPEMKAMVAYMNWLGSKSAPGKAMAGTGLDEGIKMPARAADPIHGRALYEGKCAACHGAQGLGVPNKDFEVGAGYQFPPIAGDDAYDDGGHMYMVRLLTRFLHANMPFGATASAPLLSVDEAYDIAPYVDSELPRKHSGARADLYPFQSLRLEGFAIPENFPGDDAGFLHARFGPYASDQP